MDVQQLAERNRIFYTRAGSCAYGLATPTSDEDFRGVFIGLPDNIVGLYPVEHCELSGDNMIFELRKFISLAKDCNPNIIELLFVDESDILLQTEWWQRVKAQRELFLTKKAKFTFSGYAMAQLKKIRGHNRWLGDPQPVEPPEPAKYLKVKPIEGLGHREVFDQAAYDMALKGWRQYWEWKNNRNEKRAALEEQHGYDCYLDDTEFLTEDGWKRYDDILDGTKIATLNQTSSRIEFQIPLERISKPFNGSIAFIHTQQSDCAVTLNHRMWVSPASRSKKNDFSTAYVEHKANWQFSTLQNLLESKKSYFHIRVTGEPTSKEYEVEDDYLILLGCYITEGCVGKRLQNSTPSVLRFSQKADGRLIPYLEHIRHAFAPAMRCYKYLRNDPWRNSRCFEYSYTMADRKLAPRLVSECGVGSLNKKLPEWTYHLSLRQTRLLLDVLIAGDGTNRKHSQVYHTSSKTLADNIQTICIMSGIISQVWGPYPDERYPGKSMYQVYIGKQGGAITLAVQQHQHITIEEVWNRKIVCFTVPNELLVTRRNGKIAVQGNTKHAMHLIRLLRMGTEIMRGEGVKVKRADREELLAIRNGQMSYEELVALAEEYERQLDNLYQTSTLPQSPDVAKINKLMLEIYRDYWAQSALW